MKRFTFRFFIALLTFLLGLGAFFGWEQITGSPYSDELTLTLVSETPVLRVGQPPVIKLYITNHSYETVTLVHPGDGSSSGWRTPVLRWSILESGVLTQHPTELESMRCGNVNPLEWDEVFRLAPGETREIDNWLWLPSFKRPGDYRVTFSYANRPSMEWIGIPLGTHNPIAMWRVSNSTECALTSNEVLFTVNE